MRLAGPLHASEQDVVGQAFLVARMRERVRRRSLLASRLKAGELLASRHAGYVCSQEGERRNLLIETIRQSLMRKRLTVVVHAMRSNAAMLRYLHGERLPEASLRANKALLLVPAKVIWPSRRPDPAATLEFVDELHALGNRLDHREVQLISDANHMFIQGDNDAHMFALEEWWNRARVDHVNLACLYRANDLADTDIRTIAQLHPRAR